MKSVIDLNFPAYAKLEIQLYSGMNKVANGIQFFPLFQGNQRFIFFLMLQFRPYKDHLGFLCLIKFLQIYKIFTNLQNF